MEYDSPDLFHGAAGRGLLHTWVYQHSAQPEDLAAALSVAHQLSRTCERTSWGPFWRIPVGYGALQDGLWYGIAHGSAGVAFFFAELAILKSSGGETGLLEELGRSLKEATRLNSATGLLDWPESVEVPFRNGIWCHGSAGIALAFLQLFRALGDACYLEVALGAADSALAHAHSANPTQCHGLAGLIEVYLELFAATGDDQLLRIAHQLGERLRIAFVVQAPTGPMICAEDPKVLTSDFMTGSGGGAAALARLLEPHRLGHYLSGPRRAFAYKANSVP